MSLIELQNIEKRYHLGDLDVPVLRGVTLTIEQGEFIALVGSSTIVVKVFHDKFDRRFYIQIS